jgi:hypothetical protein
MGTIRNRVTLVHHYNFDEITKLRDDAIKTFNKVAEEWFFCIDIVGPIMVSPCNSEYTFMIQGDCSKNGWSISDKFNEIRMEWCEKHKNDGANIVVVNLGEDYPASIDFDSNKE